MLGCRNASCASGLYGKPASPHEWENPASYVLRPSFFPVWTANRCRSTVWAKMETGKNVATFVTATVFITIAHVPQLDHLVSTSRGFGCRPCRISHAQSGGIVHGDEGCSTVKTPLSECVHLASCLCPRTIPLKYGGQTDRRIGHAR